MSLRLHSCDQNSRLVLVPFNSLESIPVATAAKISGKSENTIRLWAERYVIGRKIGGDFFRECRLLVPI